MQKYYQHPEISKETQGAVISSPCYRYFISCYPAAPKPSQCPHTKPPRLLQHSPAPIRNIPKCMAPGDTWRPYRGEQGSLSCHPPAVQPASLWPRYMAWNLLQVNPWLGVQHGGSTHSLSQLSSHSNFLLCSWRKRESGAEKQFTMLLLWSLLQHNVLILAQLFQTRCNMNNDTLSLQRLC